MANFFEIVIENCVPGYVQNLDCWIRCALSVSWEPPYILTASSCVISMKLLPTFIENRLLISWTRHAAWMVLVFHNLEEFSIETRRVWCPWDLCRKYMSCLCSQFILTPYIRRRHVWHVSPFQASLCQEFLHVARKTPAQANLLVFWKLGRCE